VFRWGMKVWSSELLGNEGMVKRVAGNEGIVKGFARE